MLFDTHAHYYAEQFDPDRDEVLSALPAANVGLSCAPAVTWKAPASPSPWPSNTPSSTLPPGSTPKTPSACRTTGWSRWRP